MRFKENTGLANIGQKPAIGKCLLTIAIFLGLLASTPLQAQRYLGSITGEIVDSTGAKVPGATVIVEDVTTHFKSNAVANGAGAYSFPALNPDTYTVIVTAASFKSETRANVVLTAGQIVEADFSLHPGAPTETIQVRAESALLDTASANIATTLSTQEVTDLPNEGRNPYVQ